MMDTFVDDPFIPQPRVPHPALKDKHEITFDIEEHLFDSFFSSDEYRLWASGLKSWQLHCSGGPGCGKVLPIEFLSRTCHPKC